MYTARMHLGLNQRLGLSRNKVAVPEGVAGTPPFWNSVAVRRSSIPLIRVAVKTFILLEL
jgi:hypothetical protein